MQLINSRTTCRSPLRGGTTLAMLIAILFGGCEAVSDANEIDDDNADGGSGDICTPLHSLKAECAEYALLPADEVVNVEGFSVVLDMVVVHRRNDNINGRVDRRGAGSGLLAGLERPPDLWIQPMDVEVYVADDLLFSAGSGEAFPINAYVLAYAPGSEIGELDSRITQADYERIGDDQTAFSADVTFAPIPEGDWFGTATINVKRLLTRNGELRDFVIEARYLIGGIVCEDCPEASRWQAAPPPQPMEIGDDELRECYAWWSSTEEYCMDCLMSAGTSPCYDP